MAKRQTAATSANAASMLTVPGVLHDFQVAKCFCYVVLIDVCFQKARECCDSRPFLRAEWGIGLLVSTFGLLQSSLLVSTRRRNISSSIDRRDSCSAVTWPHQAGAAVLLLLVMRRASCETVSNWDCCINTVAEYSSKLMSSVLCHADTE